MDPVTLLGIATTSYGVLRKGIAAGKEIEEYGWRFGSLDGCHTKHQNISRHSKIAASDRSKKKR